LGSIGNDFCHVGGAADYVSIAAAEFAVIAEEIGLFGLLQQHPAQLCLGFGIVGDGLCIVAAAVEEASFF